MTDLLERPQSDYTREELPLYRPIDPNELRTLGVKPREVSKEVLLVTEKPEQSKESLKQPTNDERLRKEQAYAKKKANLYLKYLAAKERKKPKAGC